MEFSVRGWSVRLSAQSAVVRENLPLMLQRFLTASYAYYRLNESVMSDSEYDHHARTLLLHWSEFDHVHKHLVTEADLEAGTLYGLKEEDYPGMVKGAARHLINSKWGEG
jgi:hypothetical protein